MASILLATGASIVDPTPATVLVLLATTVVAAAALLADARLTLVPSGAGSLRRIITVALIVTWLTGLVGAPVLDPWFLVAFTGGMLVAMLAVWTEARRAVPLAAGAIVLHAALATVMVATLPRPTAQDVDLFPRDASAALVRGENPYAITYPNIYGVGTPLYAPEVQSGDRLGVGFPYPPISLLLAMPGELLAGDHRYAAVAAIGVSALLLAWPGGTLAVGAAVLLAASPLTYRVIYNGWSEPLVVPLVVGSVVAAWRAPRIAPIVLGCAAVGKQYALILLVTGVGLLAGVRRHHGAVGMALVATVVAAVTVVPFLLWNPAAFLRSTVEFHLLQPLRPEAASIPGLLLRADLAILPAWIGFAAGGLTVLATLRWAPRTPLGFALGSATVYLVFFLFSKQAFMNYWFFVLALLLAGVAVAGAMRQPENR